MVAPHVFCAVCGASGGMHYGACTGDAEGAARALDTLGNVEIANGHGTGKKFFRRADAIRRRDEHNKRVIEVPTKPGFVGEVTSTDLHRDGNPECEHTFSQWEQCSGLVERDGHTYVELHFESHCTKADCDARVGRMIETEIFDK